MGKIDKDIIIEKLQENLGDLKKFGVYRIGLFGSYIRNEQTGKSDIDLMVEFMKGKKTFKNFLALCEYTENIFGRKVELVTPESLSPYISPYIKKEVHYVQVAD